MLSEEQLEQATKRIFQELRLVGPSVEKPSVKTTSLCAEVNAGNLRISIYDLHKEEAKKKYFCDVAKAKDFSAGLGPNEHYIRQGILRVGESNIGWYLTAKN